MDAQVDAMPHDDATAPDVLADLVALLEDLRRRVESLERVAPYVTYVAPTPPS